MTKRQIDPTTLQQFFFPEDGITIEADSFDAALEQLESMKKEQAGDSE